LSCGQDGESNMIISKQLLKTILVDSIEVIRKLPFVEREIKLEDRVPTILVGVRRCGKSFILYQKMHELVSQGHHWEEFLYVNFEDERLIGFDVSNFNLILEAHYELYQKEAILFFDEIQNIEGWEKFARRMADEKRIIFITGSNTKMLSKEMESVLGGRFISKMIYPYRFAEYLNSRNITWNESMFYSTKEKAEIMSNFKLYFLYGGFPELVNFINKRDYLSSIYQKIYLGDIVARHNLPSGFTLEMTIKKLAESVGQALSYNRLKNIISSTGIGVGTSTVIQYLEYAKESQIIFSIRNYASKLVDTVTSPKYYFIDNGLLNLFLSETTSASANLENLVAISLVRKFGNDGVTYYKDNIEVDFYIPKASLAIQACYILDTPQTREREINALVKLSKYSETQRNIILTYDDEEVIRAEGIVIEVIPIWKWLLNEDI